MATPTLDSTAGGSSSNTYATLAQGDAYHSARLFATDWTGATDDTKNIALLMATRVLDAMMIWNGLAKYPDVQALQWPRAGMLKRNGQEYVADTVIPQELVDATSELARQLIVEDRTADSDIESKGITSLTAGPVSLTFKNDVPVRVIPDAVINLLVPGWGYPRSRKAMFGSLARV